MKKTTNALWGGRFEKKSSDLLKKINNSINFDFQLAAEDVQLNKSYALSLYKSGILKLTELKKLKKL